jgi:hypothetical protein
MRQGKAIVALVCGMLAGCATSRVEPTAPHFAAAGPFAGASGADMVHVEVYLVERPYGDTFINRGLWDLADQLTIGLERKATLDANGFRVCQIGGMPPAGLQDLLASRRSCPNPRLLQTRTGQPVPIPLGAPWKLCRFRLHHDGLSSPVELTDAQCLLDVLPTLTDEGQVRLQFTPHIKHGTRAVAFVADQEPSGVQRWARQEQQPEERYDRLSWEMVVSANEYVVIGTRLDIPCTLGQACFLPMPEETRLQRLLVVRTGRSMADAPSEGQVGRSPPLALRAGLTAAGKND